MSEQSWFEKKGFYTFKNYQDFVRTKARLTPEVKAKAMIQIPDDVRGCVSPLGNLAVPNPPVIKRR